MRDPEAKAYVRTLVLAALLGVPVAFAAVLFQTAIHDLIHLVWEVIPDELGWSEPAWWYVILVPGLAGLLVAAAVRLPGHGGHSPLEGLGADPIPPIALTSILPAALATLGLGLVLGPEAPLIALGLGLGAIAVRLIRLEGTGAQLLVFAGAFAAVAALFGGPLIAAFLLFEVTAASGKIPAQQIGRALLPGFVAAGTGALVFTGVAGWSGLHQTNLSIPSLPPYESSAFHRPGLVPAHGCRRRRARRSHSPPGAWHRGAVGPRSCTAAHRLPGSPSARWRSSFVRPPTGPSTSSSSRARPSCRLSSPRDQRAVLVLLVVTKGLAYALSLGAGFRGGPVFPAIAIGVAAAMVAADVLPGLHTTPAVAAGIAAGTTAVLRVPFTAVLLVSLLMGPSAFDVAPIAVLAAATGWLVATVLPNPEDRLQENLVEAAPACAPAISGAERYFGSASSL